MLERSSPDDARNLINVAADAVHTAASTDDTTTAVVALCDPLTDVQRQYIMFFWNYYRGQASTSGYYAD